MQLAVLQLVDAGRITGSLGREAGSGRRRAGPPEIRFKRTTVYPARRNK